MRRCRRAPPQARSENNEAAFRLRDAAVVVVVVGGGVISGAGRKERSANARRRVARVDAHALLLAAVPPGLLRPGAVLAGPFAGAGLARAAPRLVSGAGAGVAAGVVVVGVGRELLVLRVAVEPVRHRGHGDELVGGLVLRVARFLLVPVRLCRPMGHVSIRNRRERNRITRDMPSSEEGSIVSSPEAVMRSLASRRR